ncbi:MAG: BamA/TamA family outer membrane protein [bacterium]
MKNIGNWLLGLGYSLVIVSWLLVIPASAAEVDPLITDIQVRGNKVVAEQEIMNVIFSRLGETLFEGKVQSDIKAIYALGSFNDVTATYEAQENGTRVVFIVKENPTVKDIIIENNTIYSTAEIISLIEVKTGSLLNYSKLQQDIEKINNLYKDNGYILARVIDVETNEESNVLTFKIIEGVIESIALDGNDQTQDYVILRELNTTPGSVLNQETLKNDLRRVFNLGFFSQVNPLFEAGTSPDKVVLLLKIEESRSSTINFGGGYGEREGWFGFADLSINNLMGTAQGLMIRGQSGSELTTYQFRYTNPWFMPERLGDHASFTFRRWYTRGRDIYLAEQNAIYDGFDISLGKPFRENYKIAWTLGSELVNPYDTASFEAYQSDTIGLTLSYDTRDFWLNPKEGRYYSFSVKQGWKYAASGTSAFFKLSWDLNHYYSLIENHIFATHLGAGIGFDDIPIGEEFWAGGANTVRGYNPSESLRGTRKLILNTEYRLFFSDLFQGVFFYDWGGVWDAGSPDFTNFITGWGPGVRINTPLGPIRLDYGVPKGKTFGEGVMHFSIGQAF